MRTRVLPIVVGLIALLSGCVVAPGERDGDDTDEDTALTAEPAEHAEYGSTYNSNCYCLVGLKYCDVGSGTVKSGTCP